MENACSCTGANLDRFVRPCVMAVLATQPDGLHGYVIAQRMREIALFKAAAPDLTGLYRVLKSMEAEGYLAATWDEEGQGPAKRVYLLTASGRGCLEEWSHTLRNYIRELHLAQRFISDSLDTLADLSQISAGNACCAVPGCDC